MAFRRQHRLQAAPLLRRVFFVEQFAQRPQRGALDPLLEMLADALRQRQIPILVNVRQFVNQRFHQLQVVFERGLKIGRKPREQLTGERLDVFEHLDEFPRIRRDLSQPFRRLRDFIQAAFFRRMPAAGGLTIQFQIERLAHNRPLQAAFMIFAQHEYIRASDIKLRLLAAIGVEKFALRQFAQLFQLAQLLVMLRGHRVLQRVNALQDRILRLHMQPEQQFRHRDVFHRHRTFDLQFRRDALDAGLQMPIIEGMTARLPVMPRTRHQPLDVQAGKAAQRDLDAVFQQREKILRMRPARGQFEIAMVRKRLHKGEMPLFVIRENRAAAPMRVRGEAVRPGDEPGRNAGRQRVEFEAHGDFAAVRLRF